MSLKNHKLITTMEWITKPDVGFVTCTSMESHKHFARSNITYKNYPLHMLWIPHSYYSMHAYIHTHYYGNYIIMSCTSFVTVMWKVKELSHLRMIWSLVISGHHLPIMMLCMIRWLGSKRPLMTRLHCILDHEGQRPHTQLTQLLRQFSELLSVVSVDI